MPKLLVVGAGPAGSSLALRAARSGIETHLIDKQAFPRDKVCGCTLNRESVRELDALGIDIRSHAVPIKRVQLGERHFMAEGGWACSRRALDTLLVEAAKDAGVLFNAATPYKEQRARLTVVATGLGGGKPFGFSYRALGKRALVGLATIVPDSPFPAQTLSMRLFPWGYLGLVQLEDGRLDVAAAVKPSQIHAAKKEIESELGSGRALKWHGTKALNQEATQLFQSQRALIGDAALYAEPFTGEGIRWALQASSVLTRHLSELFEGRSLRWEKEYRRMFYRESLSTRMMIPFLSKRTLELPFVSAIAGRWVHQRLSLWPVS